jgi:glutamate transport system permease protein
VTEAAYQLDFLVNRHADALWPLFFGIAAGYLVIVFILAGTSSRLEKRWAVAR